MPEKRYETALYDNKARAGYCVLDKNKPSITARLHYENVLISTKDGCDIVAKLLNDKEYTIKELVKTIRVYDEGYIGLNRKYKEVVDENNVLKSEILFSNKKNKELQKVLNDNRSMVEVIHENKQLKQALLFYLDLAISSGSKVGEFDKNMDKWCKLLFNCSYGDAKVEYGKFEHAQRWELE